MKILRENPDLCTTAAVEGISLNLWKIFFPFDLYVSHIVFGGGGGRKNTSGKKYGCVKNSQELQIMPEAISEMSNYLLVCDLQMPSTSLINPRDF